MLFVFFFVSSLSLKYSTRIERKTHVIYLPEFGFDKGGTFKARYLGTNVNGSLTILLTEQQYYRNRTYYKEPANFCTNITKRQEFIFHISKGQRLDSWDHVFLGKDVYFPVFYNCLLRDIQLDVEYKNNNTYLDRRDQLIPYIAMLLSLIYTIMTLLWIFNIFQNQRFNISLVNFFAATTAIKALSIGAEAYLWAQIAELDSDNVSFFLKLGIGIFDVMTNSLVFLVNGFASNGLSTLRPSLTISEFFYRYLAIFWYFFCRKLLESSDDILFTFIYTFVCTMAIASYAITIGNGAFFTQQIGEQYQNDNQIALKTKFALKFNVVYSEFVLCFVFCTAFSALARLKNALLFTCEETIILLVAFMDYMYFYIRDDFVPPEHVPEPPDNDRIDPKGISYVEEPGFEGFAFVTTPTQ